MSRKLIVAVIGGGESATQEVETFGGLVSQANAILLTGGKPLANTPRVTERALIGCQNANGLMISVLPDQPENKSVPIPGERRFEVHTKLSKYGRDPITGAAADLVFVFPGESGTLVELAYASIEGRPVVFCGTAAQWKVMCELPLDEKQRLELDKGVRTAVRTYLPGHTSEQLMVSLGETFKRDDIIKPITDVDALKNICNGTPINKDTHFRGLPRDVETSINEFRKYVKRLSEFGPNDTF
jgi:uncharacterized protein (TIGR00725 family)